ncbi:hypothetical protein K1719_034916 [Acacia pycnantha]|nr:hypothetical protein K1719_034916 [Acacia pycnantha]
MPKALGGCSWASLEEGTSDVLTCLRRSPGAAYCCCAELVSLLVQHTVVVLSVSNVSAVDQHLPTDLYCPCHSYCEHARRKTQESHRGGRKFW